ncbi:MAG: hypothetical protein AB8V03_05590 [Francisella endosymbiont of Hyalomma asiaticum]
MYTIVLWHTQQTIEALQKNKLVIDSELFIYSDAPKNENAIEKVQVVEIILKLSRVLEK